MRTEEASLVIPATKPSSHSDHPRQLQHRLRFLLSPLWLCLLFALLIRIWLVVHTRGVIAGDEAMVGIQAEHILQGERPVYYYGQSYMGSLEAYFAAMLFAIAGASVWTLRAVSILLSLLLVFLTWRLAGALADATHLPFYARQRFKTIAALVAALPPLYDAVIELRMMGGYIEAFVIMAWLLLSGLRLTQRWQAGASVLELALRWAGIGLLIGLGMWTDPLIISAVFAIALWIVGYCIVGLVKLRRQSKSERRDTMVSLLKGVLLSVTAIPAALIGFAPALYWGSQNQWQNIVYILNSGGNVSFNRLLTILQIQNYYNTCIAPRIIGGALPTEPYVTYSAPHLVTFGLVVGAFCLFASFVAIGLSLFWRNPFLLNIRRLTGFPLLFAACSALSFSISNVSIRALEVPCGPWDLVGRYADPLLIAVPFFIAAIFTTISVFWQDRGKIQTQESNEVGPTKHLSTNHSSLSRAVAYSPLSLVILMGLLMLLVVYLGLQSYAYVRANAGYTFQTSACVMAPANNDPVIAYMQSEHIYYAWSHGWLGDPISFKTNSAIKTSDPRFLTQNPPWLGRLPNYTLAVMHADRPSILTLVKHNDPDPPQLQVLTINGISYHLGRFTSEPGYDILVITPLNRAVTISEAVWIAQSFSFC